MARDNLIWCAWRRRAASKVEWDKKIKRNERRFIYAFAFRLSISLVRAHLNFFFRGLNWMEMHWKFSLEVSSFNFMNLIFKHSKHWNYNNVLRHTSLLMPPRTIRHVVYSIKFHLRSDNNHSEYAQFFGCGEIIAQIIRVCKCFFVARKKEFLTHVIGLSLLFILTNRQHYA